jgi:undecaprenyl diphosphate synthase
MDGNRRWAKRNGKLALLGHKAGFQNAITISELVGKLGVPYLTLWALSKENLDSRDSEELS